jgi:glycogen phosphorylase
MFNKPTIAYFSMEIGVRSDMPTYSGGLGILAGDTIRSAADMQVPMVAVSLLYRKGYFFQRLDESGWQREEAVNWVVEDDLVETNIRTYVTIEGRQVLIRAWRFDVVGTGGFSVPVFFLDTDQPENSEWDRKLTHSLYGGDEHYRLCQETILGFGGVRILRALGFDDIRRFHMNEGHAALLTLELLREEHERAGRSNISQVDVQAVYDKCVFTTHTPVPSGHDQFSLDLVDKVLGNREACGLNDPICHHGQLNMTFLALSLSRFVNGVAKKHGEVSRHLFADYKIDAITNGVHAATWISPPFTALFDKNIPGWKEDNFSLRAALSICDDDIWYSHQAAKHRLIEYIDHQTNAGLDIDSLTIGVARRAAAYKRVDLIFDDLDRLRRISRDIGRIQLVFAGKAHPRDAEGKRLIQDIIQCGRKSQGDIIVTYLPNYDMALARTLIAGVDVWLNTPEPPLEASGTSGMKAAMNGVPSLSVLDGWWIEGCIEDVTGWAIGSPNLLSDRSRDANSLYDKLENTIIPRFYHDRHRFIEIMRHAIALNGSFFNTQRMLQQYVLKAYFE